MSQSGLSLSRPGMRVTAFCPDPDQEGTVLRLWEQAGQGGPVKVQLPPGSKFTQALPVNLRGEKSGEAIPLVQGGFSLNLKPWEPASFQLK